MRRSFRCLSTALAGVAGLSTSLAAGAAQPPNLVIIVADDIGYGDLGSYGATVVSTPKLDAMAKEGLRFTDGYSPASTCTPTRYSLITGQYGWRSQAGSAILDGDAGLAIPTNKPTIASLLKGAGYATGMVGKWHLGLGTAPTNYNAPLTPGFAEIGFDYAFAIPATGDRVPTVFVENKSVVGWDPLVAVDLQKDPIRYSYSDSSLSDTPLGSTPSVFNSLQVKPASMADHHAGSVVNGISRIGFMGGGQAARWVDEGIAQRLVGQAESFIDTHKNAPFFLYFATHDIHVPRWPDKPFRDASPCGLRCAAILELDFQVGAILKKLDELNLSRNTLVVFSSDNGPILEDGYQDGSTANLNGHNPQGALRGTKNTIFEGGTRVPFITRWPGVIKPGTSSAIVALTDMLASAAALSGKGRPAEAGPDSFNVLEALLGLKPTSTRDHIVTQANGQNQQAIRVGDWKLIPGPSPRLFNLATDLHEDKDVAAANPAKVQELAARLNKMKMDGSSRPANDGFVFVPLEPPAGGVGGGAGSGGVSGGAGGGDAGRSSGGSASGGASPGAGGSSAAGTSGSPTGGIGGAGAGAAGTAQASSAEPGCGCRAPRRGPSFPAAWGVFGAWIGACWLRARQRRSLAAPSTPDR